MYGMEVKGKVNLEEISFAHTATPEFLVAVNSYWIFN